MNQLPATDRLEENANLNVHRYDDVRGFERVELQCIQEELTPRSYTQTLGTLKLLSYQDIISKALKITPQPSCKRCKLPEINTNRYLPPFQQDPFPPFLPRIPPHTKHIHDLQQFKQYRQQQLMQPMSKKVVVHLPRLPPATLPTSSNQRKRQP